MLRTHKGLTTLLAAAALVLAVGCGKEKAGGGAGGDSTAAASGGNATEQQNIDRTKEFMEKVFNNFDTAVIDQYIAADFVEHNPSPGQPPGVAGLRKFLADWRTAFPDMKMTIDDIFASGDKVVMRSTMTGTNTGALMGMPASGKPVKVELIDILVIKDGKATEHWGQGDFIGMMTQLGHMPSDGGAAGGDSHTAAPAGADTTKK